MSGTHEQSMLRDSRRNPIDGACISPNYMGETGTIILVISTFVSH